MHTLSFASIFALSLSLYVSAAPTQGKNLASIASAAQNLKKLIQVDPKGITNKWVGQDPCKYTGFFCVTAPNGILAVASIDFNGFHLGGSDLTIGNFLAPQTELALLHLNTNGFKGAFPSLDGKKYPYIYEIDVSNNLLSGPFPDLFSLDLTFLDLRFNQFSGNLPKEVFTSWKDIQVFFLNDNQFTGSIPDNLASFGGSYLVLANNKFTGPVPGSIGSARNLYEILLLGNSLSGPLPSEIGASKSLNLLDVSNNSLTGPIPASYGGLTNATNLNFAGNHLTGGVPESVCKLPQIQTLNFSSNALTQTLGPACKKLFKAKTLIVDGNCIPGLPEQRPMAQCSSR